MRYPNRTGLECLINSKVHYKTTCPMIPVARMLSQIGQGMLSKNGGFEGHIHVQTSTSITTCKIDPEYGTIEVPTNPTTESQF